MNVFGTIDCLLNKDVALKIFSYISHVEKFILLKRVCKKWNEFLKDKWFWRSLMISEYPDLEILPSNFDSEKWFWYKFVPNYFQLNSKKKRIKDDCNYKIYLANKKLDILNLHNPVDRSNSWSLYPKQPSKEDLEKEVKEIESKNKSFGNKIYRCLQQGIIITSVLIHESKEGYRNVKDYHKLKLLIPTLDGKFLLAFSEEYAREKITPIIKAYLKLKIETDDGVEEEFLFLRYNSDLKNRFYFKGCQSFIEKYICPNQKLDSSFNYEQMYQLFGMNYNFVKYCCCPKE